MTEFTIIYNNENGTITLNLEKFFERKESGRFENTIKPDIYKIFKLVNEWCDVEQIKSLLTWLSNNKCKDLVDYYKIKYSWVKEYIGDNIDKQEDRK